MNTDELLDRVNFTVEDTEIDDKEAFEELHPSVREWWIDTFGEYIPKNNGFFTPPQKEAIPHIKNDENTLIASPTGSGKTLASFTSIISDLFHKSENKELDNNVFCLYISPLKSLANDIHKNLSNPLKEITENYIEGEHEIRHAIRHGDTPKKERSKMLDETPHILNTTPETLAILLNSPRFKEKLKSVEYVIVDEIHSLADNKRGVHLSVSLERLERITEDEVTRIGCSATVEPLDKVGRFLCGKNNNGKLREFEIVDTRFAREYDLTVESPVEDLITTDRRKINEKFYSRIHQLIQEHSTTIIFTNTRSGSENVLASLRRMYDNIYTEENSGCHHGSLSKQNREEVEEKLKDGSLDFVSTSTSLELGIDMQDVDLVIQVGSPKSIAGLLQRVGRAGHRLGQVVEGKMIVLNRDELVECSVMAERAKQGFVDRVFIPKNCQDVAAQHVYGMAINGPLKEKEVKQTLKRAYPYNNYTDKEYEQLIRYLVLDYDGLEDKNVYPKIWRDTNDPPDGEYHYENFGVGEPLIGKKGRLAQQIYMTNIGTIPDSFTCDVKLRKSKQWVGDLDEEYLDTLNKGDVFTLGGQQYEYQYRRGSNIYVDKTNASPTVPRWFSERLPLSYDLGKEIINFQQSIIQVIQGEQNLEEYLIEKYPINRITAKALSNLFEQQVKFAGTGSITTNNNVAVEEYVNKEEEKRNYYIQTSLGREFNDGLSRVIAKVIADQETTNVNIAVDDNGFAVTVPQHTTVNIPEIIAELNPKDVERILRKSIEGTDFLERYFRINATRSLLVLVNYKGNKKSAAKQQFDSEMLLKTLRKLDEFAVVEETYREIMEDKLNMEKITEFITEHTTTEKITQYTVNTPSPRVFNLAQLSTSDTVYTEEQDSLIKEFHQNVLKEIN